MTVKTKTEEVNSWCKVLLVSYPMVEILPYWFDRMSRIQVAGFCSRQRCRRPEAIVVTVVVAFYFFPSIPPLHQSYLSPHCNPKWIIPNIPIAMQSLAPSLRFGSASYHLFF
jgi:hypothetical protein